MILKMAIRFLIVGLFAAAFVSSASSLPEDAGADESEIAQEPYEDLIELAREDQEREMEENEEIERELETQDEIERELEQSPYDINDNGGADIEELEEDDEVDDEVARGFSWGSTGRKLAALRKDVDGLKAAQRQMKAALARCRCGTRPPRCPRGYTRYQPRGRFRFCYKANTACTSWNNARATCKREGGDLIVLQNSFDLNYFKAIGKRLFKSGSSSCGSFGFWIGASDQQTEGKFKWVNGRGAKLDKYWGKGQPDNLNNEDCVHVWAKAGYTLNDAYCDGRGHVAGFFCARRQL